MSINTLIAEEVIGYTSNGEAVKAFTLSNEAGAQARFVNFGASFIGFSLPWQERKLDLVLGCDTLDALLGQRASLGATVGRYANRIGQGRARIDGEIVQLDVNSPPHHLHGGHSGFGQRIWDSHLTLEAGIPTLTFSLVSPDGDAGFPGEVKVEQCVRLMPDHSIDIRYRAETDRTTLVNLTNHAYFNLSGATHGDLKDHEFRIPADHYTEVDATALPTGRVLPVAGGAMDLREWTDIGARLESLDDATLARAKGYDHNYVFGRENLDELQLQAEVRNRATGFWLKCSSTLPGLQFYTGNFLEGEPRNASQRYRRHGAFCLEPGYWPDSPNHDAFPDCTLRPGETYRARIVYRFGHDEDASGR